TAPACLQLLLTAGFDRCRIQFPIPPKKLEDSEVTTLLLPLICVRGELFCRIGKWWTVILRTVIAISAVVSCE
ncbi:hypothetical protein LINPERHAP1_LOCUS46, partial [Linum perenne]